MKAIRQLMREKFGFPEFREGQEQVMTRLLDGKSVVAIFPTGAGKSLCYQLPALLLEGVTLVVSPLIALMKDQIDFLHRQHVAAARLDSSVTAGEMRETMTRLRSGELKLLYVAPERLSNERFLTSLQGLRLAMLAVDEAHCISEWGHNFRPDYLKLARLARELKVQRVLALTATATPEVADDIARSFGISPDDVVRTGFYRPNLRLRVTPAAADRRLELLRNLVGSRERGPTLVYVTLQKSAEEAAEFLRAHGLDARAYHAGMDAEVRHGVQDWFMASSDGIVCATIAFGMGIDKRDIRYIYHLNLPKGLESYAQEIGRAGRDGLPSICEMLACGDDVVTLQNFSHGDTPTEESLGSLIGQVLELGETFDVSVRDLSVRHDIRPLVVETALTYLELDGWLECTGPFYSEYSFRALVPVESIPGRFDPRRAQFLEALLGKARKARVWWSLDVPEAARELGESRPRILSALGYLDEQGWLEVKPSGVRVGYRRLRQTDDPIGLRDLLAARFTTREARDLERIDRVLQLVGRRGCYTSRLLEHFGESRQDCGHCGWCEGERFEQIPSSPCPELGGPARALVQGLVAERKKALGTPRQLTRFLCGLVSPASSRSRLPGDRRFGAFSGVPFTRVMEFVREQTGPG